MAPTPFILDGVYKITNCESNLVVNLNDDGRIVGAFDGAANNNIEWRIENGGNGRNQVFVQNLTTGTFAFAAKEENAALKGTEDNILWTVVKAKGGKFALQYPGSSLIWVSPHGQNRVEIILRDRPMEMKAKAKWTFRRLHD